MKRITRTVLALALPAFLAGQAASARAADYTNVQLVSINVQNRTLVIRNAQGVKETLQLDDNVAGFGNVKAGDQVIVSVRDEPGHNRVSSIMKSNPSATVAAKGAVIPVVQTTAPLATSAKTPAGPTPLQIQQTQAAFNDQVAGLSQQARAVDSLWRDLGTSCKATVSTKYEGAREWFGIWDGTAKADLSSGFCRDLYNQIVSTGEPIKKSMANAEDTAGKVLEPGQLRDIRKVYLLDWDGWTRPAPDRLAP